MSIRNSSQPDESGGPLSSGITWITSGETVVGLEGPNGEEFAVLLRNPDGSVSAEITPRTGTLNALLATTGGVGEISTSTDAPAVVLHDGEPGGAYAVVGTRTLNLTGTGDVVVTAEQLKPNARGITITADAGVTGVTDDLASPGYTSSVPNGLYPGQRLTFVNQTGLVFSIQTGSGLASFYDSNSLELVWTGTTWEDVQASVRRAIPNLSVVIDDDNGIYKMAGLAGKANNPSFSMALSNAKATWPNEFATQGVPNITGDFDAQVSTVVLGGYTTSATASVLQPRTSASPGPDQKLMPNFEGFRYCRLRVTGFRQGTDEFCRMEREFAVRCVAGVMTIMGLQTVGTDYIVGLDFTPTVTAVLHATNNNLEIRVTGAASRTMHWCGRLEMNCNMNLA